MKHDKDIEENTLGCLLVYPHLLVNVSGILKPEYLYHNETKAVYNSILRLYKSGVPVNMGTVTVDLKKESQLDFIGGAYYVSKITNRADNTVNSLQYNCLFIHELFILRELEVLGNEIVNASNTAKSDPFEIIERLQKRASELTNIRSEKIKTVGDFFTQLIDEQNEVLDGNKATGLMSGLNNIDARTGGWQPGNLIVIAARPGMGKTAIALTFAMHPAKVLKKPVAFFSIEMNGTEITGRMAATQSELSNTDIIQKKLNRLQLQRMAADCIDLADSPIFIDETPSLSIKELVSKAKKLYYEQKIELVVVDYLQKMKGSKNQSKEQEVSEISGSLKELARELNIPVIALASLNRGVEDRPDKRPTLRDLRDSGAIESDADIVAFLFRPEYYDLFPNGYEFRNEVLPTPNLVLFDIAKGRGIDTREIPLKFYGEFMQVKDYPIAGEPIKMLENNTTFLD